MELPTTRHINNNMLHIKIGTCTISNIPLQVGTGARESVLRLYLLPVRPERQLLEHTRRRVTYRRGREVGSVLGAFTDTQHHVRNQALAPAVGQAAVHGPVVGKE